MICSHRRARVRAGEAERGETLIELLATVTLMSVALVTLITAIFTLIASSDRLNRSTRSAVTATEVAESMKAPVGSMAYVRCARPTGSPTYPAFAPGSLPDGWTARIVSIDYVQRRNNPPGFEMSGSEMVWRPSNVGCNTTGNNQEAGLQRITVEVATPAGSVRPASARVTVVKRNRDCLAYATAYQNADGAPC